MLLFFFFHIFCDKDNIVGKPIGDVVEQWVADIFVIGGTKKFRGSEVERQATSFRSPSWKLLLGPTGQKQSVERNRKINRPS